MRYSERVLYVDDDPLACRAFARAMRQHGFIVDTAQSGEEALEAARTYPYAVLAADWKMPGLDGLELVERVRNANRMPACLLVTGAWNMAPDPRLFQELGVVDVIRKPWNTDGLASSLRLAFDEFYARPSLPAASSRRAQRVLLLDPSAQDNTALEARLAAEYGYITVRAHSEQEALELLEQHAFAAVHSDVGCCDSLCCERVRRLGVATRSIPIIALGADNDATLGVLAVRAGAQDFLDRPTITSGIVHRSIQHAIERQKAAERLAHIAHHDPLTELPNRTLLEERLTQAISRARRRGRLAAVFFLDLDRFKPINDSLGHAAGDELLRQVALRLKGSVRETDTVARLGGDEFAVVLEELEGSEEVTLLAQRILNSFATPFRLEQGEVATTTSIGIALHPHNGDSAELLLKRADTAMYRAKSEGRDNYRFYSDELHARAVRQTELETALREAINNEEFELTYQPQVRTHSHEVIAVEVLLRWRRPGRGVVMPSEFASLLDDTGLVMQLGDWVLRHACQQLSAWNSSSRLGLRACINVSPRQFENPLFADSVRRALEDYGLQGEQLELEVQEAVLLKDTQRVRTSFELLKALGVRIAIDDFGTGFSSLTCLRRYPLDTIKIGRSFVSALQTKAQKTRVAAAILGVGRSLGLSVVAVGVERRSQLEFLERQGCDAVQGFLIAKPMSAVDATAWLRNLTRAERSRASSAARAETSVSLSLRSLLPLTSSSDVLRGAESLLLPKN
jgi:diguanylate cyclase (GGDEF)-like protein